MGIFAAEQSLPRHLSTHRQFPSISRANLLKLFGREIDGNRSFCLRSTAFSLLGIQPPFC
jgi:hypothetical protein